MDHPKSEKLEIIIPAYRMHSQSFNNALEGISEADALRRINGNTNHVIWMTGNLVSCRYWMASLLGLPDTDPNEKLFFQGRALDENLSYPTLEELKQNFSEISPKVYQNLLTVTGEDLGKPAPVGMEIPFVKENVLNIIGMCIGREDYLLGQIGLMRKLLGLPAMSYDLDENISY